MTAPLVKIDSRRIIDRDSFHDVFAEAFGFFDGYGRNMDAWVDCLTSLDDPGDMTQVHAPAGSVVTLQIDHVDDFAERCPDLYEAIVECSAFVNWRRIDHGGSPVLALSFSKRPQKT